MTYQSLSPFDGKLIKDFDDINATQYEAKLAAAQACYDIWRHKTYAERAVIIAKAAKLLHEQADAFAHTMTLEMGKRIGEARGEVEFSSRILTYYAKNAERFLAPVKLNPVHGEAHMESSPIGVIFGVEPWNFPYYQLADLDLLRQERRTLPGPRQAEPRPRRSAYGEQPDRRDLRRGALELPLLSARADRRAAPDGGQYAGREARRHRTPMRARL
jgi:hypothetical protein